MKKLLSVLHPEWIKILNYRTFWILTGLYAATLILLLFSIQSILNNMSVNGKSPLQVPDFPVYAFPGVWQNLTYIAGFLKVFPALLIIILITNEFTFRTIKQQIITGTSRLEFIAGKISLIFLLSVSVAFLVGASGLIAGLLQDSPDYKQIISSKVWFVAAHALELFTFMMFAALLAFLFKRAGTTIIVFLLYSFIIERILVFRFPEKIGRFLPLEAAGNLVPLPNSALMKLFGVSTIEFISIQNVGIYVAWIVIFAFAIYGILIRRDL
jgi:ABC-type transport system involved in multi-copper enzyme maturation permease subunit